MDTATSKSTINMVIVFLGVFALIALGGVLYLIDQANATGAEVALVSSPMVFCLGAIAALLGNTRTPVPANPPVLVADAPHAPEV